MYGVTVHVMHASSFHPIHSLKSRYKVARWLPCPSSNYFKMVANLALNSTIQLPCHTRYASAHASDAGAGHSLGRSMPRLGLGVFKNDDAKPAVLAALKSGYRCVYIYPASDVSACKLTARTS